MAIMIHSLWTFRFANLYTLNPSNIYSMFTHVRKTAIFQAQYGPLVDVLKMPKYITYQTVESSVKSSN
jgi:hypothetical protein